MAVHVVTLHVPSSLYERLKRRAELAQRTVEAELLDIVATAVPVGGDLPSYLAEMMSSLPSMEDEVLWRAARGYLPEEAETWMEDLHIKRQREGLTDAEVKALDSLVNRYEQQMLVRAHAAALLKERGYDVSSLLTRP